MSPFVFRVESVGELCEFLMKMSCCFRIKNFRCGRTKFSLIWKRCCMSIAHCQS